MTETVLNTDSQYPNYPLREITDPGPHDVMCGRGGGTNNHSGNIRFRQLVNEHKLRYLAATKVDKPKVAREVVALWRAQSPPGRFLTKTKTDSVTKSKETSWHDVGDQKAREKASQCLRERTPDVLPFVQSLQAQQQQVEGGEKRSSKPKVKKDVKPDAVGSGGSNSADRHLQELQRLQILHQQQQQALMALQAVRGTTQNECGQNPIDPETAEKLAEYLRKQGAYIPEIHGTPNDEDNESIDPTGSAREIAAALFGGGPVADAVPSEGAGSWRNIKQDPSYMDDREAMMEVMSKKSWVQSFSSIDSDMLTAHSLGKIEEDDNSKNAGNGVQGSPSPNLSRELNMKKAKAMNSNMSMISELTDYDGGRAASVAGSANQHRSGKMKVAKGMNSNVSMMSELTDMTGDFSKMGIDEED